MQKCDIDVANSLDKKGKLKKTKQKQQHKEKLSKQSRDKRHGQSKTTSTHH